MKHTKHRRYGWIVEEQRLVGLPLTFIAILLFLGLVFHTLAPSVKNFGNLQPEMPSEAQTYHTKEACDNTECWIVHYANQYNVDSTVALRIAHCESSMDVYARNPNSTASGLYQFVDKTWDNYCEGNVYDEHANIQCFLQLYEHYPEWWECK